MVIVSDNTATNVVLERLGVDAVNAALPTLGMPSTRVVGPLQVPPERRTPAQRAGESARTTAADVHGLLVALDDGRLLSPSSTAWARETLVAQLLRHGVPRRITGDEPRYGGVTVGSKSGSLHAARHDAGIVWDDDRRRLATVVVLSADVPDGRYSLDHPATLATARLAADALALVAA
jgi:beta-lactamase class A